MFFHIHLVQLEYQRAVEVYFATIVMKCRLYQYESVGIASQRGAYSENNDTDKADFIRVVNATFHATTTFGYNNDDL